MNRVKYSVIVVQSPARYACMENWGGRDCADDVGSV